MIGFDRFNERAQDVATRAYEVMQRYHHTQLDTEHVLLALLEQSDDIVIDTLEQMQVQLSDLRTRVELATAAARRGAASRSPSAARSPRHPRPS